MIPNLSGGVRKLARILAVPVWRAALRRQKVAAGVEHATVLRQLAGCRTVVDIGANRGQFALVSRHCCPDAQIFSFEPLPEPAEVFERLFKGVDKVRLFRVAIGTEAGNATIHVSRRDDSSSLLPIGALQDRLFPGTAEKETQTVRVGRLRKFLRDEEIISPALLKLDVQGYELEALKGCDDLLHRFTWVYAECSFVELYEGQAMADDVIAWLQERAFALTGIYHMNYDRTGKAVQADFLFRNKA